MVIFTEICWEYYVSSELGILKFQTLALSVQCKVKIKRNKC